MSWVQGRRQPGRAPWNQCLRALPTCRFGFVWATLEPVSFVVLEACKFGLQNKRISFHYPVFLLFSWFPGPLFRSRPRETVTPLRETVKPLRETVTPSLRPCVSLKHLMTYCSRIRKIVSQLYSGEYGNAFKVATKVFQLSVWSLCTDFQKN